MQAGLRLCCSQPSKTGFLATRPICTIFKHADSKLFTSLMFAYLVHSYLTMSRRKKYQCHQQPTKARMWKKKDFIIVQGQINERYVLFEQTFHLTQRTDLSMSLTLLKPYGPRRNKTYFPGFRQSEFQTSLLSYRD